MDGKILITKLNDLTVTSYLDSKDEVIELSCETEKQESYLNNIYVGRVKNIVKNINAAFIEFSKDKVGYFSLERFQGKIREGDNIVVQVLKDNIKTKFPVLTNNINLTGKYVVLITENSEVHFSSKIKGKETTERLKNLVSQYTCPDFGFIIRTNAGTAAEEEIIREILNLIELYREIQHNSQYRTVYSLLYKAPNDYIREIMNSYDQNISEIITDLPVVYEDIKDYLNEFNPLNLSKLRFYEDELLPLNKLYNIEKAINDATRSRVWLKSGAYLIIQPTEALTVVDVNSGKNVDKKSKREQFLNINLEAAKEIAKQLRLRNISGIIIVDFINLETESDKKKLLSTFETYLKEDHIKTVLVGMTKLNLVELTRKKIKKPLFEQINACKHGDD